MTRDEIMALEGRALDSTVAAHVFGWVQVEPRLGFGYPPEEADKAEPPYWAGRTGSHKVPHYSTDLGAAWTVFCWLAKHKGYGMIDYQPLLPNPPMPPLVVWWGIDLATKVAGEVDDAPALICRAALCARWGV